jgi:hypothetical protein
MDCPKCKGFMVAERIAWTKTYQQVCVNCGLRLEPGHEPAEYRTPQREPHGHGDWKKQRSKNGK